jgi:hypothetical protein
MKSSRLLEGLGKFIGFFYAKLIGSKGLST